MVIVSRRLSRFCDMDKRSETKENLLSYEIRGAIFDVYNALGPGLLESSYEAALMFELKDRGLSVKNQVELPIFYKGNKLDINYRMDIVVNDCVIVELKSVTELLPLHKKQLYTYLKLANKHLGILVNFNCNKILDNIVRVVCKVNNDADACE